MCHHKEERPGIATASSKIGHSSLAMKARTIFSQSTFERGRRRSRQCHGQFFKDARLVFS
jgi:hypothetical protein